MKIDTAAVTAYLSQHARPLDRELANLHFAGGQPRTVLDELSRAQNDDGGFGHGIEPDFILPQSSALGTTVGFQYLSAIGANADEEIVRRGVAYLRSSFDPEISGWAIVPKDVDDYPHAPWWTYEAAIAGFGWGNPSAEILGYFLKYEDVLPTDDALIADVTKRAVQRLRELAEMEDPDFNELACYARLYACAGPDLQTQIFDPLVRLILGVVKTDPRDWGSYCATPLTFISSPDSPFATLYDTATLDANLDHVASSLVDGVHWAPVWNWGGNYPDDWATAREIWSGKITVDNMLLLQAFDWAGN
jgi:hypothetical protein